MTTDWRKIWSDLGMDLEKHDEFLAPLPAIYGNLFLS